MSRTALVTGVAFFTVTATLVWLLLGPADERGGGPAPDRAAGERPSGGGASVAQAVPEPESGGLAPVSSAPSREVAAGEGSTPEPGPERVVEGVVRSAAGTPLGPDASVVALVGFAPLWLDERSGGGEERERVADYVDQLARLRAEAPSTAALGPGGAFRLAVPARLDEVWLDLDGAAARFRAPVRVRLRGETTRVELVALAGAVVRGRVEPPAGWSGERAGWRVVGAARPSAWSPDARRDLLAGARVTATDAAGEFSLAGLPAGVPLRLFAEPAGLAPAWLDATLAPGEARRVELVLAAGATVRGRTVDGPGNAVADARVVLAPQARRGLDGSDVYLPRRRAASAADGTFTLTGAPAGEVELNAACAGHASDRTELSLSEGEELGDVRLVLERGLELRGRVVWEDGAPAAGAQVAAERPSGDWYGAQPAAPLAVVTADEDGRFALAGLERRELQLRAWHTPPGSDVEYAAVEMPRPGPETELVLRAAPTLRGTAVDEAGEPVTAFELMLLDADERPVLWRAFEDEAGRFSLAVLEAGRYRVEAAAAGFAPADTPVVSVPDDLDAPLTLVLKRSASVAGVVLTPSGDPAAGAEVRRAPGESFDVLRLGALRVPEVRTFADAEGRFELAELAPGGIRLVARAEGYAPSEALALALPAGGALEDVVLALRRGATLTGEVLDEAGAPAPGRPVQMMQTGVAELRELLTDELGRFRAEHLTPGTWQVVTVRGDELEPDPAEAVGRMLLEVVELADGESAHVVLGAPPAAPVLVRGRVTVEDEGVEARMTWVPDGSPRGIVGFKMATSDDEGRFEVQLDEPGPYLVTVERSEPAMSLFREHVAVPAVATHELDLAIPAGRIAGRVTFAGGERARNASVHAERSDGADTGLLLAMDSAPTLCDAGGGYELVLQPGVYDVIASGGGWMGLVGEGSGDATVAVRGVEVRAGERREGVDLVVPAAGELRVSVLDATGAPAPQATVWFRDAAGHVVQRLSPDVTDDAGELPPKALAAGAYTAFARGASGCARESAPVEVRAGETAELSLRLEPGGTLRVSVAAEGGAEPISAPRITVRDDAGRLVSGLASIRIIERIYGEGYQSTDLTVGPLPPGTYAVRATGGDGRAAEAEVDVDVGGNAEVELAL
ncbi:MAG: carboxypeptidase regulatory-like domain-containing protein [Planctomycetota bacterium]